MRFFIELSYNGSAFHGWQNQPNAMSVQETIETALCLLLKESIEITGAGRTDTGVHAKQMFAHFDTEIEIDTCNVTQRLNKMLPQSIAIHNIVKVHNNAHARFDAVSRTYLYRIALTKNVFNTNLAYYVTYNLDIEAMKIASKMLLNYTNFQCFSKINTDVKTYTCNIMETNLEQVEDEIHFTITANRFLRNMVRAIVGTLINIGTGKIAPSDLEAIILSKSRSEAGYSVPGHALFLTKIVYPKHILPLHD